MITSPCGVRRESRSSARESSSPLPARRHIPPQKDGKFINLGAYGKGSYREGHEGFGFDLEKYSMRQQGEEALRRSK